MIEKAIPLPQLARDLGISVVELRSLARRGIIKAIQLPGGELAVSESEAPNAITREMFDELRDIPITVIDAMSKYDLKRTSLIQWIKFQMTSGKTLIRVLKPGYKMELDEADVAYCAAIYHKSKSKRGSRVFDREGNPYTLKHQWLADYRRKKQAT